jgi:hypothetical protein
MRTLFIIVSSVFVLACDGKPSAEKCAKVAEHVVSLSTKSAVGDAAAKSGSARELLATADAAKTVAEDARNSKQYKAILEGCQQVPESVADCMLAAKDHAEFGACRPK